jgi:hypothetical protein
VNKIQINGIHQKLNNTNSIYLKGYSILKRLTAMTHSMEECKFVWICLEKEYSHDTS